MKQVIVDGFELSDEYKKRLLSDLKGEGVKNEEDLQLYLNDHWHTKDMALKSHLLLCRHPKKRNFALPFEESED